MAVSGIDHEYIGIRCYQGFDSLVIEDANCGPDQEPTPPVPCRYGVLLDAVDVPHSNQAGQLAFSVDQQKLFDFMLLENFLCLFEGRARRACYQVILDHNSAYLDAVVFEKLQISASQNTDKFFAVDDGDAGDVLLFHKLLRSSDRLARR